MEREAKIAASLGREIQRLRDNKRLSQKELGLRCPGCPEKPNGLFGDDVAQIETGRRIPTFELLQAIAVGLETTASALLSKIGLSEQEFKDIRPRWHKNIYLPSWWEMEASTAKDINGWLVEDVIKIKRKRGRPRSLGDLDELNGYISQLFAGVRHSGTTYPGRPLVRNPTIHLPRNDVKLRWEHPFLQFLTQGYFGEGPRITVAGSVPQKLWPIDIWEMQLKPIIDRGGKRATLADSILKNFERTDNAFREQMERQQWQYLDIVMKSAIEKLAATGELSPDSSAKYLGIKGISPEMVRHLLEVMITRLWLYEDTYHLALLDDISDPTDGLVKLLSQQISEHFWTVKPGTNGQLSLIVTEWPVDRYGRQGEVHHHVDNADIANTFIEIFGGFRRTMPAKKLVTDRVAITRYLNAQRRKVPKSFPQ